MPSNEQRRQAAKRKLERQLARRAERARRRRIVAISVTVVAVLAVVGGIYFFATQGDEGSNQSAEADSQDGPSSGSCEYTRTPDEPAKDVGLPRDSGQPAKSGTVKATLDTSQGQIPITMDRAKAPCTVQSMRHLIERKYFDNTPCHRATSSETLSVLQCGDPTGEGSGGPGYAVPDELPKDLKPAAQSSPRQPVSIYPRGSIAMANSGQKDSGGSQFFLVHKDSMLPPNYTVFGTIDKQGLATLDKIAAAGITPGQDPRTGQPTPGDGAPKQPVNITKALLRT
ncbi:MAG: peptidylprolyl isomerase [Pseudonocardiaceae bacterium]|nr:peptidylprolyl isomerase [Pseudonocardiaceae bacterium]